MEPEQEKVRRVLVTLDVIGDKWKPLILWHLLGKPKRYSELRRAIPDITEKMLIQQLRELEQDCIIVREVRSEKPPVVAYSWSEHGKTLQGVFQVLSHWGRDHTQYMTNVSAPKTNG